MSGPRLSTGPAKDLSPLMKGALEWCAVPPGIGRLAKPEPSRSTIRALFERGLITHNAANAPLTSAGVEAHKRLRAAAAASMPSGARSAYAPPAAGDVAGARRTS